MIQNTKLIEIDLRGGITPNETLAAIGPRLWFSANNMWGYR